MCGYTWKSILQLRVAEASILPLVTRSVSWSLQRRFTRLYLLLAIMTLTFLGINLCRMALQPRAEIARRMRMGVQPWALKSANGFHLWFWDRLCHGRTEACRCVSVQHLQPSIMLLCVPTPILSHAFEAMRYLVYSLRWWKRWSTQTWGYRFLPREKIPFISPTTTSPLNSETLGLMRSVWSRAFVDAIHSIIIQDMIYHFSSS